MAFTVKPQQPQDYGLINGLANGVNSFLNTYTTMKNIKHQQRMQELTAGVKEDENGDLQYTPEKQAQIHRQGLLEQSKYDEVDPTSGLATTSAEFYKKHGLEVPEGLGYSHQIKMVEPLLVAREKANALREARGAKGEKPGADLTPAQKSADVAYGKDYQDYIAGGGYSGVEKNLKSAEEAIGLLESGKAKTGGFLGAMPKFVRDFASPDTSKAQGKAEQAVQASLKQVLGGQFTEREGQAILERTWNPRLSTEDNIASVKREVEAIRGQASAKEAAAKYYEDHGTISGYKGTERLGGNGGLVSGKKYDNDVVAYADKHGITPDQALAIKIKKTGQAGR